MTKMSTHTHTEATLYHTVRKPKKKLLVLHRKLGANLEQGKKRIARRESLCKSSLQQSGDCERTRGTRRTILQEDEKLRFIDACQPPSIGRSLTCPPDGSKKSQVSRSPAVVWSAVGSTVVSHAAWRYGGYFPPRLLTGVGARPSPSSTACTSKLWRGPL
jgi:hypothetical protein